MVPGDIELVVKNAVERIKVQMKERRQVFQQVTELIQQLKADG